jgi:hypothetical protein
MKDSIKTIIYESDREMREVMKEAQAAATGREVQPPLPAGGAKPGLAGGPR